MRFSIRDLLWATLVVAIGLAWWLREEHWRAEVDRAPKWRTVAGALENVLVVEGWHVKWNDGKVIVQKDGAYHGVSTTDIGPSTDEP